MKKTVIRIVIGFVLVVLLVFTLAAILGSGSAKAATPLTAASAKQRGVGLAMPPITARTISIKPPAAVITASGGEPRCFSYQIENPYITNLFHKKELWVKFIKDWCIRHGRITWAPEPIYEWGVTGYGAFFGWKVESHSSGTITNATAFTQSRVSVDFVQDFSVGLGPISISKVLNSATLVAEIYGDTHGHHSFRYS